MYEGVHGRPEGESTVARLALTARNAGFDGIVVRNHCDARGEYNPSEITEAYDIDVVDAIEIRADDSTRARGLVGNFRSDYTVVCVHGGPLNRFAVEEAKVDVLAHPMRDGDVNHVLARAAAENGVRLELNLERVLRTRGSRRVRAIQGIRKLWDLVEQYDVPYVVSGDPYSHLHIRSPRELSAVGRTIGMEDEVIRGGLQEWGRLAVRNRKRQAESFIEPGIREGRYEEDD